MVPRTGWQDPNNIQQRAFQNWQTRINIPKGNPNAPQTFMNMRPQMPCGCANQYQMYYQQCIACGQTPMSQIAYMQALQQGVDPMASMQFMPQVSDPIATLQTGIQTGKSIIETVTDIVGLFKGNKTSKASAGQTEAQKTIMNNYQAALQNKAEFKVDNLKDFVNAQFAGMKADGNIVTTEQYTKYLEGLGFDNDEASVISKVINMNGKKTNSDDTITKKELQSFYKLAMGSTNTLSAAKLEQALQTIVDNLEDSPSEAEVKNQLAAKGYTYVEVEKDGTIVSGFQKEGEFIPMTDTDKLLQILDE